MAEDISLTKRRQELNRQITFKEDRTLVDLILDGAGKLFQKLTHASEPPSFWYSGILIGLATILVGLLISILAGEFSSTRYEVVLLEITLVGSAVAALFATKIFEDKTFTVIQNGLLDAMESAEDLKDFQNWLAVLFNVRRHLIFSFGFGICFGLYDAVVTSLEDEFVGLSPTIIMIISYVLLGVFYYYVIVSLNLSYRLGRYQIKLFTIDPSNSEIISHLRGLFNSLLYIASVFVAIYTIHAALFRVFILTDAVFLILFGWGMLIAIFVTYNQSLAKIITRAKWKTLNKLQTKIEELQVQEDIPSKDTLANIRELLEYHDYITSTRNSMLNFRAGLGFLNSMLLPVFSFILVNRNIVIDLFNGSPN